ncbi:MAG: hypothetical protein HQ567_26410 [Candidatus Nealsonbacteria bacterium]|nr:hypothetical protein [Candidatus Nealsonbacteria bacterium]
MRSAVLVLMLVVPGVCMIAVGPAAAQQVTVATPFNSVSDSFFERNGVSWGGNWKGGHFSVFGGNPNIAAPQFGGFDPGAGINGGVGVNRNGFNGQFNFGMAQGSRRSMVSQTPMVTLSNGQPGFVSDTSQSPFVIGFIPVVGGYPSVGFVNPMVPLPGYSMADRGNYRVQAMQRLKTEAQRTADKDPTPRVAHPLDAVLPRRPRPGGDLNLVGPQPAQANRADADAAKLSTAQASSAGRAVPSVAEARRLHKLEEGTQNDEAKVYFERGRAAEEGGKAKVAKIYYDMALKRAHGEFREQIQTRLNAIGSDGTP